MKRGRSRKPPQSQAAAALALIDFMTPLNATQPAEE
jgi:hypothetical protein